MRQIGEFDRIEGGGCSFPNDFIEACDASVEVVCAMVYRKMVLLPIKGEVSLCNAVGIAAYGGAIVVIVLEPIFAGFPAD